MRQGLWDRRLGGRSEPKSPLTRFGTSAGSRFARPSAPADEPARAGEPGPRRGPRAAALVLAASFAAGFGGGSSLAEAVASWLGGREPRVEAIAVRGASQLSKEEVAEATGVPRGEDLRRVQAPKVASRLTQHPWIASARAVELPEGRLLVEVVERVAVATVSAPGSDAVFAVDGSGRPFAPAGDRLARKPPQAAPGEPQVSEGGPPQGRLPRLVQSAPVAVGQESPELAEAVAFAGQLAALGLPRPVEIGVSAPDDPTGYWLRLEDFAPRILLGREELDARLQALARLLEAAPPAAAEAAVLDLRFADQVVLRGTPSGKPEAIATGPHAPASGQDASGGRARSQPGG
jgi:hypothetical protein